MVSEGLIIRAKELHGHVCPFLVLGLRASEIAMKRLGVERSSEAVTISEELIAIVECNNCFADGVQVATGCTFGNNCLVYLDLGKNAVTLVKRGDWNGVRVYIDRGRLDKYFSGEAMELFEKVVVKREGSPEDVDRLRKMWGEIAYSMREVPEEEFKIEKVKVMGIERAPMFENVRCDFCGELAMKTRAHVVDGRAVCLGCMGECEAVVGRGIVKKFKIPFVRG
ncbi:MAG: FmdE family protein [Candidatus Nezhaarchaeota archaeon]|nr:FmdE family protein [Candidatus Nezhaarchaeota archaeon]MCX8142428.1 FmdE family protein [Candidatus Nezhaarchaeota archaeon]MDW8050599.1 FmdE family protein [Nitrososphaerota archaeon]